MRQAFPCNRCGACCKSVGLSPLTAALDRGDGACRHYDDKEGLCRVYAQRPDACNVEKVYDTHFASRLSWPAYVALNVEACAALEQRLRTAGAAQPGLNPQVLR